MKRIFLVFLFSVMILVSLVSAEISYGYLVVDNETHYLIYDQSRLISEQNDLIREQVRATWVLACYAPHTAVYGVANFVTYNASALEVECRNAGYPTIRG